MNKVSIMNRLLVIILTLIFLFSAKGYSQNTYTLPQITPQSPNQASLGKYGEIPVSLNVGMVNIQVPLFSIKSGSVEIPISLTYHNNGLKVDEIPSWVGLGWDLNAGGVISYEQRGNPDFSIDGVGMFTSSTYNSAALLNSYLTNQMTPLQKYDYLEKVISADVDSEYDLYSYNFLGYSGKFYLDKNQNIINVPKNNLKILKIGDDYKFIDERGNQYLFSPGEYITMNPSPLTGLETRKSFNSNASFILIQIITIENRVINFNYTKYPTSITPLTYLKQGSLLTKYGIPPFAECPGGGNYSIYNTEFTMENYLLTSITFDEGSVQFELNSIGREDIKKINANQDLPNLKKVKLLNSQNAIVNEFTLNHSYFGSNDRLRLDEVIHTNGNLNSEKWQFEYHGQTEYFPPFFSKAKDHWGYYNGAGNGNSIPRANYSSFIIPWSNDLNGYAGANRASNFNTALRGVLNSIKYPTGGQTLLEYEGNKVKYPSYDYISNPFLSIDVIEPIQGETVVSTNTDETPDPLFGTFTLTETRSVIVSASKMSAPLEFIRSDVSLSETIYGTNLLMPYFSGPSFPNSGMFTLQKKFVFPPGTYYYSMHKNLDAEHNPTGGYASLSILIQDPTPIPVTMNVGGVRIKSIQNFDGFGNISKKLYDYHDDIIGGIRAPYYISKTQIRRSRAMGSGGMILCDDCGVETKIHDESVVPMVGNSREYGLVTEFYDDNGNNGKTDYTFTGADNLSINWTQPYVIPFMATWKGGLVLQKKIYKRENNTYILLQEENNSYESTNSNPPESYTLGVKADYWAYCDEIGLDYRVISETQENYQTEKFYPKSSSSIMYDVSGNLTNAVDNSYSSASHTLQTQNAKVNSKNQVVKEKIKYSFDYNIVTCTDAFSLGIKNLNNKHVLVPVENLSIKAINGIDYVLGGTLLAYNTALITPLKVFRLNLSSPVLLSAFTESFINTSGVFIKDSRYEERAEFNSYDQFNNILQERYSSDIFKSYVWDYKNMHLVAECINAERNNIAATSFEADGSGNWVIPSSQRVNTTAITGSISYSLDAGAISKSQLDVGKTYIVSYWSKNGVQNVNGFSGTAGHSVNGWVFYEHKVANPIGGVITVSGYAIIDELRLYPENAQMATYTYTSLVGLTSKCDANNKISYYQYDAFNRLVLIIDQDNNILKKICYNYAGQQEDCALACPPNSPPDWQNTSTVPVCLQGSCGNTGYQSQEQQDINPCSSTYNQLQWVTVYNPTACPPVTCVNLTSTNIPSNTGYTASYYNISTTITYNFSVPTAGGLQPLGTVPAGNYNLTISRTTGIPMYATFKSGCKFQVITGTSAQFSNIPVSATSCNSIYINTTID